jgi:hypothetical protein
MRDQGDAPRAWFLTGIGVAALLSFYGAIRAAPQRGRVLVASGSLLIGLGVLGMLSIGFPILVAGLIALVAARRSHQARRPEQGSVR